MHWETACIRSSPDPSLFVEVGLACETKDTAGAGASKSTSIVLQKTCDLFNTKHLFILYLKLQSFSTRILAFVTRPLLGWLGLGTRLVDTKVK